MSESVGGGAVRGFSTHRAAEIVGISYRQIDYWARTDLLRPSLAQAAGSGSRRLYSYGDLLKLKVIKRMLDAGIDLGKVRVIFNYVSDELREDVSAATLVIDGARSAVIRTQDELIDALQRGQGVLPLSTVQPEVDARILALVRPSPASGHAVAQEAEEGAARIAAAGGAH